MAATVQVVKLHGPSILFRYGVRPAAAGALVHARLAGRAKEGLTDRPLTHRSVRPPQPRPGRAGAA
jgi:hypothetical protein